MKTSKLITYSIAVVATVLTGVAFAAATNWTPPTASAPANNTPAPINVGGDAQTKTGALTVGSDLTITGRICLGGVCINAWPEGAVVAPVAPVAPVGDVVNGVCGTSNGLTFGTAPATNLCSTGTPSAVSDAGATWSWICNGSGGGISSPCNATHATGWVEVATANKPAQDLSNKWSTEKTTSWTANGPIYGVRVSGNVNDGGYCYASWGTGNVATWRTDPTQGVYNVNNLYYDGSPIYTYDFLPGGAVTYDAEGNPSCGGVGYLRWGPSDELQCMVCPAGQTFQELYDGGDSGSYSSVCLKGYNTCPINPPSFSDDGTAKLCQNPWGAGLFTTKSLVNLRTVPQAGTAFKLKSNFVDGPNNGIINCKMEVWYK